MKLLLTLAAVLSIGWVQARTWTSADGSKTFKGTYVSSTETTCTVTIKGRNKTFKLELLSEADRKWIKEEDKRLADEAAKKPSGKIEDQRVGKRLIDKTVRLKDGSFAAENMKKVPEHYVVYFAASW